MYSLSNKYSTHWWMRGVPVIVNQTAEPARESATAFVATKISFINEL